MGGEGMPSRILCGCRWKKGKMTPLPENPDNTQRTCYSLMSTPGSGVSKLLQGGEPDNYDVCLVGHSEAGPPHSVRFQEALTGCICVRPQVLNSEIISCWDLDCPPSFQIYHFGKEYI